MEHRIEHQVLTGIGRVEAIIIDGKRVGAVYRSGDVPDLWVARTASGEHAETREQAIAYVLQAHSEDPSFTLQ